MGNFGRFLIFLAGVICIGQVSEASELDDLNARLASLESSQRSLQQSVQSLGQVHDRDVDNVTQLCQGLQIRADEQKELMESLQESLEENQGQQLEGPCSPDNHRILDDAWRSTDVKLESEEYDSYDYDDYYDYYDYYYYYDYFKFKAKAKAKANYYHIQCDRDLPHGWYRFLLHGENAVVPTSCVEDHHCQTHAPQWVDYQGQSVPAVGQEVRARACANWNGNCCLWESPITVRNCGPYFVYYLEPSDICYLAHCTEPQD